MSHKPRCLWATPVGDGVYIRRTPQMIDKIRAWADGTPMVVIGRDTFSGGVSWKSVSDPAGNLGWVPAQYLSSSKGQTASTKPPTRTPSTPIPSTGNLRIVVLVDGQPFPGKVRVQTHYGQVSNIGKDGSAFFSNLPPGVVGFNADIDMAWNLRVSIVGWRAHSANVRAGETTTVVLSTEWR